MEDVGDIFYIKYWVSDKDSLQFYIKCLIIRPAPKNVFFQILVMLEPTLFHVIHAAVVYNYGEFDFLSRCLSQKNTKIKKIMLVFLQHRYFDESFVSIS